MLKMHIKDSLVAVTRNNACNYAVTTCFLSLFKASRLLNNIKLEEILQTPGRSGNKGDIARIKKTTSRN